MDINESSNNPLDVQSVSDFGSETTIVTKKSTGRRRNSNQSNIRKDGQSKLKKNKSKITRLPLNLSGSFFSQKCFHYGFQNKISDSIIYI